MELANLNVPTCSTGAVRGVVNVDAASTGDILAPVNCESTLADPVDDLQAFTNGYAPLSIIAVD